MKKCILGISITILILLSACSNDSVINEEFNETTNYFEIESVEEDVVKDKAVILIGNEFGNTYFEMKSALELQNFEVITVGVGRNELMSSCPNHENILIEPDMNITDLDEAMLMEYKVLFIPSGKHHRSLPFNKDVQNILNLCKENQLIISSVCAGNIVLTETEDLVNGYSIASSSITFDAIKEAGGIIVYKDVVEDGVFITGGKGGGKTGNGFEDAPIEALALKIREAVDAK